MSDEKKIIIDEDWKTKVEREKEATKHPAAPAEKAAAPAAASAAVDQDPQMPPASFEMLVTTLATEALMALGQIPHPVTGEVALRTNQAKYLIDTIDVLREKTKNNLSPNESKLIEAILHQARMVFISVTNEHGGA